MSEQSQDIDEAQSRDSAFCTAKLFTLFVVFGPLIAIVPFYAIGTVHSLIDGNSSVFQLAGKLLLGMPMAYVFFGLQFFVIGLVAVFLKGLLGSIHWIFVVVSAAFGFFVFDHYFTNDMLYDNARYPTLYEQIEYYILFVGSHFVSVIALWWLARDRKYIL
jgi:hypothetical protein